MSGQSWTLEQSLKLWVVLSSLITSTVKMWSVEQSFSQTDEEETVVLFHPAVPIVLFDGLTQTQMKYLFGLFSSVFHPKL